MHKALEQGLTSGLTVLVLAVIARCAMRPARVDPFDGKLILSFGWPLRLLAWGGTLFLGGLPPAC